MKTGQCHIYVTFNLSCRPAVLQNEGARVAELGGPTHAGGHEESSSSSSQHVVVMERDGEDVHCIKKLHLRGIYRIWDIFNLKIISTLIISHIRTIIKHTI